MLDLRSSATRLMECFYAATRIDDGSENLRGLLNTVKLHHVVVHAADDILRLGHEKTYSTQVKLLSPGFESSLHHLACAVYMHHLHVQASFACAGIIICASAKHIYLPHVHVQHFEKHHTEPKADFKMTNRQLDKAILQMVRLHSVRSYNNLVLNKERLFCTIITQPAFCLNKPSLFFGMYSC